MSTDNISVTAIALPKRSKSRKDRAHSHNQSTRKSRLEQFHVNRTRTAINRPASKLPHVSTKSNLNSATFDSMLFKRYRSPEKDRLASSPSRLERQTTLVYPDKRLPVLYSLTSDDDRKRTSDFRRRQIYALNHFMRGLEQEQFRQFCQVLDIKTEKSENVTNTNEETTKDLST